MKQTRLAWTLSVLSLVVLGASCGGGGNPLMTIPEPQLLLVKTASSTTFDSVGQIIDYSYSVTNTGNVRLGGPITIEDDKAADESCPALNTTGNNDDFLDVGEQIVCTASYTITQQDVDAAAVTNIATASANHEGDLVTSNQDSATVSFALVALFTANPPSADPRISMEAGASTDNVFTVEIHGNGFVDLFGVSFTLDYDPTKATYLGCEAQGSILSDNPSLSNPCNGALIGGAKFGAELQNGVPGLLNAFGTKDGQVAGEPNGTGLIMTFTFQALVGIAPPGTPFEFEMGTREVTTCPAPPAACQMPMVDWDGGTLTATAN